MRAYSWHKEAVNEHLLTLSVALILVWHDDVIVGDDVTLVQQLQELVAGDVARAAPPLVDQAPRQFQTGAPFLRQLRLHAPLVFTEPAI